MKNLCCALLTSLCCGLAAAEPAAAPIPFKHDAAGAAASLPGGALGLLLLSALAIGAVYVVRKRLNLHAGGANAAPRHLRVLETQRLGPRTLLSVIEFAGGRYLIAQSEQGVSCLVAAPGAAGAISAAVALPDAAPDAVPLAGSGGAA